MSKLYPKETIYGFPIGKKNHYRAGVTNEGKGYIFKDAALTTYERLFVEQCKIYKGMKINEPFTLFLAAYLDNKKADLDNIATTILDSLQQSEAITDDCLCRKIVAEKRCSKGAAPRVEYALQVDEQPKLF